MVGHIGPADRAEENRVAVAQGVERAGRHHAAGLDEVIAAPRMLGQPQREPVRATDRLEDLERRGRDLAADAVAGDHGDRVGSDVGHVAAPGGSASAIAFPSGSRIFVIALIRAR